MMGKSLQSSLRNTARKLEKENSRKIRKAIALIFVFQFLYL